MEHDAHEAKGTSKSYDLGRMPMSSMAAPMYAEETKKKMYPSLRLRNSEFAPTKSWEVGKEYTLTITVKMVSKDERGGEFDVVKATV